MSYSNNPLLPKARAEAVRLVVEQRLPVSVAARKSGIHRTTLWRWYKQWHELNKYIQLENNNRPKRAAGSKFRLSACTWRIPTRSSRPHKLGRSVSPEVIERIHYYRTKYRRCAEIVHAYCLREGTKVSLSTVRRVLRRLGLVASKRYRKKYRTPVPRPVADTPGKLVQTDTVHLTSSFRKQKRVYLYTAIDVFSRWAYAEYQPRISQELSVQFLARAEGYAGFHFEYVQTDNGAEFGKYFEDCMKARNTVVRHSRVRRPNDNAFIERFNRTVQEECVGTTNPFSEELYSKVLAYLAYYNDERLHLGLECATPLEVLQRY
jgi:transposase InsO family protein